MIYKIKGDNKSLKRTRKPRRLIPPLALNIKLQ